MDKQKFIIDVDVVIDKFNKRNPDLRPMTRTDLAKTLGVNTQILSDWKRGKTPQLVYRFLKLMEIGKCNFKDFVIEEKDGDV